MLSFPPRLGVGGIVMLTKSKSHWFYVDFKDQDGKAGNLTLKLDKTEYEKVLAAAKKQTGKDVETLTPRKGDPAKRKRPRVAAARVSVLLANASRSTEREYPEWPVAKWSSEFLHFPVGSAPPDGRPIGKPSGIELQLGFIWCAAYNRRQTKLPIQ